MPDDTQDEFERVARECIGVSISSPYGGLRAVAAILRRKYGTLEEDTRKLCRETELETMRVAESKLAYKRNEIRDLENKLARALETLKFYADKKNYDGYGHLRVLVPEDLAEDIVYDRCGNTARKCIKEIGDV